MSPSTDTREYRESACELKFLVNPATAEEIRAWARSHLQPDPHCDGDQADGYRITSLYFDTGNFDVFHRRGSFGRSKYRIRRYGLGEVAFLERKLKTKGLLAKRRSILNLNQLDALHSSPALRDSEAFWFHRRILARGLRPICQIAYRRTARFAVTDLGPIRLTLDDDLRALPLSRLSFDDQTPSNLVLPEQWVLELKFRGELPALFKGFLQDFALAPQAFSKYRHAARVLGCVPEPAAASPSPDPAAIPTPNSMPNGNSLPSLSLNAGPGNYVVGPQAMATS